MNWSAISYTIPLIISALVSAGLIWPAWRRREMTGVKTFIVFAAAASLWCIAYALEILAPTLAAKMFWVKVQYIGITHVATLFLIFSLQYTRLWPSSNRYQITFFLVPWLTLAAVWLEPGLGLFYYDVALDDTGPFLNLALTYGPLFWTLIVYSYLALLLGSAFLIWFVRRSPGGAVSVAGKSHLRNGAQSIPISRLDADRVCSNGRCSCLEYSPPTFTGYFPNCP